MGRKAWSAFECTALANNAKKYEAEQKRLFYLGYDAGMAFIQAWRDGEIKKEDLSSQVPIYFLLMLRGPSNDFILGRLYEWIVIEVYDDMSENFPKSIDLQESLAAQKFLEKNCKLIK